MRQEFFAAKRIESSSVPSWVIDWDTVFRMGHSPSKTVHRMQCTAWIAECPNLKTMSQSMTHDGATFQKIRGVFKAQMLFLK